MPAKSRGRAARARAPIESVLPGVLPTTVGATLDGRIDYSSFDGLFEDVTLLALDLHIQYLAPSGVGGYLALPLAYASGGGDSETYLGNPELGGLFAIRGPNLDAYLRGGFAVGISVRFEVPIAHLVPRPADAFTTGLDTSFLRLAPPCSARAEPPPFTRPEQRARRRSAGWRLAPTTGWGVSG